MTDNSVSLFNVMLIGNVRFLLLDCCFEGEGGWAVTIALCFSTASTSFVQVTMTVQTQAWQFP